MRSQFVSLARPFVLLAIVLSAGCAELKVAGHGLFGRDSSARAPGEAVSAYALLIEPDKVIGRIDEKVYSQFLEQVFHSISGGIWGEMVWDGSFEMSPRSRASGRRRWFIRGGAQHRRIWRGGLNGSRCLRMRLDDGTGRLVQGPFSIGEGQTYEGSLWVRGTAPGGLILRLRRMRRPTGGGKVIAEEAIPPPTDEWKEYPFRFEPDVSERTTALLEVSLPKTEGTVWLDQISMMSSGSKATGGFRPDLLRAMDDLKVPALRWPGGRFASFYHWKFGIGPQHLRRISRPMVRVGMDVNSFGTDEFIRLCRKLGAEPVIVISLRRGVQEARDWVEYCNGPATSEWGKVRAANGHPEPYNVRYWEIDNKVWNFKRGRYAYEEYAEAIREFVPAMKSVDPTIKIIACGAFGVEDKIWTKGLLDECAELIDYLSLHHYEEAESFAGGPFQYERFLDRQAELIAASANRDIKVFVSEWNLREPTDWLGLYAGGMLNVFERSDVVEMASPALYLRYVWSSKKRNNALINFDHRGWYPAPNYVVMKLWQDHYAPNRIAVSGDSRPLNVVATKSEDGQTLYLKIVNPTALSIPLGFFIEDGFVPGRATMQLVASDSLSARNSLKNPNVVSVKQGWVNQTSRSPQILRITMPRWSAAVVTIPIRSELGG